MKSTKPLIFISNDDGVQAKGIQEVIEMVRQIGDVVVVAPDTPRSGAGCSITSQTPLRLTLISQQEGVTIYACNGTPVDCVKLGLEQAVPRTPDLIIGGINHGDNSSVNVHYSGTMAIALEGAMKGIPSIGFSLCDHAAEANFLPLFDAIQLIVRKVLKEGLPNYSCLNVNFPKREQFNGFRVCRMAKGSWRNEWQANHHPNGREYFWLTGHYNSHEPLADDTDSWALKQGYIAITPTKIDVTDYELLEKLNDWVL